MFTENPVIDFMPDQREMEDKGGTMRLGLYPAKLTPGSKAAAAYGQEVIYERHRHRFEVNNRYRSLLENAGMVLSPGGITVLLLMPVVGILVTKLDARYLIAFGFLASAVSLWYMTGLTLDINYGYAVKLRVFQSIGIAFLFVPINTMSYAGVDPRKSNEVSGMTNLMRNMGGSVGISLVETMLAQRSQVHQSTLSAYATPYNPQFRALTHGAVNGYSQVYGMIQQQAAALAYLDTLKLFAALCLIMVPLAFFMKRQRPGKGPVAAH
jgi:DHA2 family multidrug resistance protein